MLRSVRRLQRAELSPSPNEWSSMAAARPLCSTRSRACLSVFVLVIATPVISRQLVISMTIRGSSSTMRIERPCSEGLANRVPVTRQSASCGRWGDYPVADDPSVDQSPKGATDNDRLKRPWRRSDDGQSVARSRSLYTTQPWAGKKSTLDKNGPNKRERDWRFGSGITMYQQG